MAMTMEAGAQVGAYRLIRQIGSGGMAEVWLAEHELLGRGAAIKVLHPMFSGQPEIVSRFFNEARAATSIADPGIVQIFDFGYHEGNAYLVMEFLDGETLEDRHARERVVAIADALRILRQVAGSLGAAHTRGIVHRDLKPENIFLVRDPEVVGGERAKILDFGIAKLATSSLKTQTFAILGTPRYMSPEQCRGAGQVDPRSDVYALGCVLFALVVGRPPFDNAGAGEIMAMHLREPAPLASSRAPWVPAAIDQLIARCLAKDPAQRFASGTELAAAIGALIETGGAVARSAVSPPPAPPNIGGQQTTLSAAAGVSADVPQRRFVSALVALGLIAGAALIAITGRGPGPTVPSAPRLAPAAAVAPIAMPAAPPAIVVPVAARPAVASPAPTPAIQPVPGPAPTPAPPVTGATTVRVRAELAPVAIAPVAAARAKPRPITPPAAPSLPTRSGGLADPFADDVRPAAKSVGIPDHR